MKKVATVRRILNKLFPHPPIPLKHSSHYTLLIAVLLSARCTDKKVNEVTPKLFAKAKTPEKMAKLSVAQIESIIRPCGLAPSKARAIKKLSEILVKESMGGKFHAPLKNSKSFQALGIKLPLLLPFMH